MAYFAQFDLDAPCVAMVTASHNENGWTGVKMGAEPPLTFGPDEIGPAEGDRAGRRVASERPGGTADRASTACAERYIADVADAREADAAAQGGRACGNGTAGAFAPEALRRMGAEVIEMDCELDWTFPNYNPNPEDHAMLHAMARGGARARRGPGARLRRRRRPLRRGRRRGRGDLRRQDRPDAGARPVAPRTRTRPSSST